MNSFYEERIREDVEGEFAVKSEYCMLTEFDERV